MELPEQIVTPLPHPHWLRIRSSLYPTMILDVYAGSTDQGATVCISAASSQRWKIEPSLVANAYYIINEVSRQNLDVRGACTKSGTEVCSAAQQPNQVWFFDQAGPDTYYIRSNINGFDLQATPEHVIVSHRNTTQTWKLEPAN